MSVASPPPSDEETVGWRGVPAEVTRYPTFVGCQGNRYFEQLWARSMDAFFSDEVAQALEAALIEPCKAL